MQKNNTNATIKQHLKKTIFKKIFWIEKKSICRNKAEFPSELFINASNPSNVHSRVVILFLMEIPCVKKMGKKRSRRKIIRADFIFEFNRFLPKTKNWRKS